jgi:drug/metabolite transporter (DMT)-like permease
MSVPSVSNLDNPLRGILCMLLAVALFAAMDAAMKSLTPYYSAMQIACLRGALAWPLVVLWLLGSGRHKTLLKTRWGLHLLRAVLGVIMLWAFVFSLQTLALAEAYAIFFTAPLLITAMSAFWLKEYVAPRHWVAIGIGLLTVLYMLKPDGDRLISIGALMALVAAICYAVSAITVRILGRSEGTGNMVFWLMTLLALGAGVLALPDWQPLRAELWLSYVLIGVTGFGGQIAVTQAFKIAPAAVVAPFEYMALLWGIGFDIVLWQLYPAFSMLAGATVIMLSGLYLVWQHKA